MLMSKKEYEKMNSIQKHNEWYIAKQLAFKKEVKVGRIKIVRK